MGRTASSGSPPGALGGCRALLPLCRALLCTARHHHPHPHLPPAGGAGISRARWAEPCSSRGSAADMLSRSCRRRGETPLWGGETPFGGGETLSIWGVFQAGDVDLFTKPTETVEVQRVERHPPRLWGCPHPKTPQEIPQGGIPQSWGHPVRPHPKSSPGWAGGPRLHPTRYAMGEYWGGGHGDGTAPLLPRDPPPVAGGSQGGTPSTRGLIPTPHSPPRWGSPTPKPPRCHGGGSPRAQINSHRDNRGHPPRP